MHLKLIECGSKLPAELSIVRLARSQAKPAGSSLRDACRRAGRVFLLFKRFLPCVFENDFIRITRQCRFIHP